MSKNISIYSDFGRNCPIRHFLFDQQLWLIALMRIVIVKSQPLDRRSTTEILPRRVCYKNACNVRHLIAIGRSDAFLVRLISAVITRLMDGKDYIIFKMIRRWVILRHVTPLFKWRSTAWILRAIGRFTGCHVASPPRPLIAMRWNGSDRATSHARL